MKKILLYGDSITDMGRDRNIAAGNVFANGKCYGLVIEAELSREDPTKYLIINRGVGGDRIVDLYARIKKDVWNEKPDVFSILIGINDIWHEVGWQNGVDIVRYEKIYRMLIEDTKKVLPEVKFMLLEPFVLKGTATEEKFDEFNEIRKYAKVVEKLAKEYGAYFVPLQKIFDEKSEKYGVKPYLYDGVHPNTAGATLIADEWLKVFKTIGV